MMTAGPVVALLLFLFLIPFQSAAAQEGPGCGPSNVKLSVKTQGGEHALPAPDPARSLLVFLQDDFKFYSRPRPTTRFGVDGTWVGATQANSYFSIWIDPGEHDVCANWQNRVSFGIPIRPTSATKFTAEPGKVYFFRARDVGKAADNDDPAAHPASAEVHLEAVDNNGAWVLIRSFRLSSSNPKQ